MLLSNGLHRPENLPVKFGFSPKSTSTNIAKKLPLQRCFKPLLIAFFSLSHKRPTFAFTGESGIHSAFGEKSHTAAYTPKQGAFRTGGYHYSQSVPHVHQHPRAGYQNGKLCRFWVLVGDAPKEHRKPSGQRCAYACRCPEGVAAPLGCVIFSLLSKLRPVRPIPETSFSSPDAPACAVPVQATSQLVSFRLEADRGFSVLSLCLTSFFDFGDKKRPLISHTAV